MSFSEILIVYLAFGAPLAVYKYLHSRGCQRRSRLMISAATFLFWIPAAVRLGYRYLTNAYYRTGFVSRRKLDARDEAVGALRESLRRQLSGNRNGVSVHEVREVIERYAGLAGLVNAPRAQNARQRHPLFEAAGRGGSELSAACLARRNRRQQERHHIQARRDFVALFESSARLEIEAGIELAQLLADRTTVVELQDLIKRSNEVWNPDPQESVPQVSSISMPTVSLNSD